MFSVNLPIQKSFTKGNDFVVRAVASSSVKDLEGDIISENVYEKALSYLEGMTMYKDHIYDTEHAAAVVKKAYHEDGKLIVDTYVSKAEQALRTKIEEGIIKSLSIGGEIIDAETENGTRVIKDLVIKEISFTPIPANPEANIVGVIAKSLIKNWTAPSEKERKDLPESYFLLPKEKKFPYKDWRGANKGKINCDALRAAISRAAQNGYKEVEAKARKLYNTHCKSEKSACNCNGDNMTEKEIIEKSVEEKPEPVSAEVEKPVEEVKKEQPIKVVEKSADLEAMKEELKSFIKEMIEKSLKEVSESIKKTYESDRVSLVKDVEQPKEEVKKASDFLKIPFMK